LTSKLVHEFLGLFIFKFIWARTGQMEDRQTDVLQSRMRSPVWKGPTTHQSNENKHCFIIQAAYKTQKNYNCNSALLTDFY